MRRVSDGYWLLGTAVVGGLLTAGVAVLFVRRLAVAAPPPPLTSSPSSLTSPSDDGRAADRRRRRRRRPLRVPDYRPGHVYAFQLPGSERVSSHSPFCAKLEHWLRLARVPHTVIGTTDAGPTGKMPFVEVDGRELGDSSHIIDEIGLERGVDLDAWLGDSRRATALAVQRMIEEHLYFIDLHYRWQDDTGWAQHREVYFDGMPTVVRAWLPGLIIRPIVVRAIRGQGIGRMSEDIIRERLRKDVEAISVILGDRRFLMGENPCNADASLFGFLHVVLDSGIVTPVSEYIKAKPNLVNYLKIMRDIYWNDLCQSY